ncbi:endonuclease III [Desulfovibrio sp. OttesenSCG-928-G15]|nr:endonuclease III [Desulfovibrio sp. OttesenSCG-928-G15]
MNRQQKKAAAQKVVALLATRYPQIQTHLRHTNAWELLAATMLAAQCTDERVNTVTPALFTRWPGPEAMAGADIAEVEHIVRPTGFYRNKAKNLVAAAEKIMREFDGEVPHDMKGLTSLPGVARKTANVVLFGAFGINEGIAVDTHVGRIAWRIGLTSTRDPVKAEQELMKLVPKKEWGDFNHRLVWFGRHVCQARKPLCPECEMAFFCEKQALASVL